MRGLLLLIVCVCVGCTDRLSVCTDIDIEASNRAWGVVLDCKHPSIDVDRSPRGPAVSCMLDDGCNGRALQNGYWEFPGDDHWVYVKDGIEHPEITLAHELGHLLGFWHSDDECNIMFPRATECRTETWGSD